MHSRNGGVSHVLQDAWDFSTPSPVSGVSNMLVKFSTYPFRRRRLECQHVATVLHVIVWPLCSVPGLSVSESERSCELTLILTSALKWLEAS
jgi:hypothetical protein